MRHIVTKYVTLLLLGMCTFALSAQSFADDPPKDVTFACSHHGPMRMMLTLSFEKGDPRDIQITGKNNGMKWFATIGGNDAPAGNGGNNADTVKVHSGDTITWIITDANHGVAFSNQDLAQAMLDFTPNGCVGQPLIDLTTTLTTDDWKAFGTKLWGTKPIDAGPNPIIMVKCKVK